MNTQILNFPSARDIEQARRHAATAFELISAGWSPRDWNDFKAWAEVAVDSLESQWKHMREFYGQHVALEWLLQVGMLAERYRTQPPPAAAGAIVHPPANQILDAVLLGLVGTLQALKGDLMKEPDPAGRFDFHRHLRMLDPNPGRSYRCYIHVHLAPETPTPIAADAAATDAMAFEPTPKPVTTPWVCPLCQGPLQEGKGRWFASMLCLTCRIHIGSPACEQCHLVKSKDPETRQWECRYCIEREHNKG